MDGVGREAPENPQACWTSLGRFAKRRPLAIGPFRTGSGRIAQLVEQLTLNQRVPGSSPGAPTKQKAILSNSFERRRPRTKRVSCDAFCGRTSHAVRRADNVLKKPFDRSDAEAWVGCWFQPRCEALVLPGSRSAGRRLLITGEIRNFTAPSTTASLLGYRPAGEMRFERSSISPSSLPCVPAIRGGRCRHRRGRHYGRDNVSRWFARFGTNAR